MNMIKKQIETEKSPSMWNVDQVMPIIMDRLASGESLTKICKSKEYPSVSTVLRWILGDALLEKEYRAIRRVKAEAEFDKILDESDSLLLEDIKGKKLALDTKKWWIEKASPEFKDVKTEDKQQPNVNINFTPEALEKLKEIADDMEKQIEGEYAEVDDSDKKDTVGE